MNRKILLIIFFSSVLFMLSWMESVPAMPQTRTGQKPLEYEANVVLKLVQVYVLDKNGKAVTDLTREDFELYDSGKLQPITDFEKHTLSLPGEKNAISLKVTPVPAKLNRKIFLFFDLAFNSEIGIKNAREAALSFIDHQLQPEDEAGVLSYSATKYLTVHENLTSNHKKVREAVEGIGLKGTLGRAEDVEQQYWKHIAETSESAGSVTSIISQLEQGIKKSYFDITRFDRKMAKQQVSIFTKSMKELGQTLSYIQGHKSILYLSAGIPVSMFEGNALKNAQFMKNPDFADAGFDFTLDDRYEEMIKALAASNSSVYPLYAQGTNAGWNQGSGFQDRQQLGKSSLQRLAKGTGGKYYGNIQDYEAVMEEIQQATSSFYVLGYSIGLSWDGKYHKIEVKIRRRGCRVQAQPGYFSPRPFAKLSALEKRLDFVELALEERSQFLAPIRFPVESLFFSAEETSGIVTLAKLPSSMVMELSGRNVELVNLLFETDGGLRHFKGWRIDFTKPPPRDVYFYSLTALPAGRYTSRIVLRNMETGSSAVSSAQAVIPEEGKADLILSSPLLLTAEESPAYLKGELIELGSGGKKEIDLADIYPWNFNSFAPIVGEINKDTAELTVVIRGYNPDDEFPEMKITLEVVDQSTGSTIPASFSMARRDPENHGQVFFIRIPSGQFKQGRYVVNFDAEEIWSRSKSRTSATFSVK